MITFDKTPKKRLNTSPKKMSPLERIFESFQWDDDINDRSFSNDEESILANKDNYFIVDSNFDEEAICRDIVMSNQELVKILIEMSFDIYQCHENFAELKNGLNIKTKLEGDDVYVFYKYGNTQYPIENNFYLACILRTEQLRNIIEVIVPIRTFLGYMYSSAQNILKNHKFTKNDVKSILDADLFLNLSKVFNGKVSIFGQTIRLTNSHTGALVIYNNLNNRNQIALRNLSNNVFSILNNGVTYYTLHQNDEELVSFKDLVYDKDDKYWLENIEDFKAISFTINLSNSENPKHRLHTKFLELKDTFTYGISYSHNNKEREWVEQM